MDRLNIRSVSLDQVLPLRYLVLRPGKPHETAYFVEDNQSSACHFAAFHREKIIGVASVYGENHPEVTEEHGWRIRGVATHPDYQGKGVGLAVVNQCIEYAQSKNACYIWCNARAHVVEFYEKLSFQPWGELFGIPQIGKHYVMVRFFKGQRQTANIL